MQVRRGKELAALARRQQRSVVVLPARPGNIYAKTRSGRVMLAGSGRVPSVYADPVLLGRENFPDAAERVAAVLEGITAGDLYDRLYGRRDKRFVYLARGVSERQAEEIRRLKIRAVQITYDWRRYYPRGPLAGQILGFRQIDGVAGEGVELQADRWLGGVDGRKVLRRDAGRRGTYVEVVEDRRPRDGMHVCLTMDLYIQGFLEQALRDVCDRYEAVAVMGVVMEPNSGAILAMASMPAFDPNGYRSATPEQRRNRAITDPYEPGSVFKPFIAVGAVQMSEVGIDTNFFCHHGRYHARRGGTIHEFPGLSFGLIPLSEIVIRSSNIGMAKLGERLGNESLHRIAEAFGFGRVGGVDLPGECPGRLVPTRRWTGYATRRMPFGQGPIMVTTLQLAGAFSTIANGGVLLRPRIIDRVIDAGGKVVFKSRRRVVRRVLSAEVARQFIDEVLVNVVERGTGKRCRLDNWTVFGKTGTAQIGGPNGYEERAYTATFMGSAPASRPAVVCVISVYRPNYSIGHAGGKVAAPCVREVLQKTLSYMDVPADRELVAGIR